jgi:hypothetical protein
LGVKKVGAYVIKKDDPHTLLFLVDDREVVAVCMLEDFDELASSMVSRRMSKSYLNFLWPIPF